MSDFSITPQNVLPQVEILASYAIKLENQINSIEKIKNNISLGSSTHSVQNQLSVCITNLTSQKQSLKQMSEQLQIIVKEYVNTDSKMIFDKTESPFKAAKNKGDSSSDDDFDLMDVLKQLAKKLGMSVAEISAFVLDLLELLGKAGYEALFGDDTDWKEWFFKYVPENVSDLTLLGLLSVMSIKGLSADTIENHRENNDAAWDKYQESHNNGKYIEDQNGMTGIQYGNHSGDYNTCEVIAAYNALQYLTDGNSPESFPDLLEHFEKNGITAGGEFGTSPQAIDSYFEQNGYDTKMLAGDNISSSQVSNMSKNYDTYIMTTYNNKSNLGSMIHTVSITKENGVYVVHNHYEDTKSYSSLEAAVSGYNAGNGEPISLIGIRDK